MPEKVKITTETDCPFCNVRVEAEEMVVVLKITTTID
jgi:hypothetical protein